MTVVLGVGVDPDGVMLMLDDEENILIIPADTARQLADALSEAAEIFEDMEISARGKLQ